MFRCPVFILSCGLLQAAMPKPRVKKLSYLTRGCASLCPRGAAGEGREEICVIFHHSFCFLFSRMFSQLPPLFSCCVFSN